MWVWGWEVFFGCLGGGRGVFGVCWVIVVVGFGFLKCRGEVIMVSVLLFLSKILIEMGG